MNLESITIIIRLPYAAQPELRVKQFLTTILIHIAIPRITKHPLHIFNVDPGSTVSLPITAVNARVYQWQVNGTDIQENSKYKGTKSSTLVIQYIQEHEEGFYSCIIGNEFLTIVSDTAAVTVCKSNNIFLYGVVSIIHSYKEGMLLK